MSKLKDMFILKKALRYIAFALVVSFAATIGCNAYANTGYVPNYGQPYTVTDADRAIDKNKACDLKNLNKGYTKACYSCVIVKTLIETFANVCDLVYDVSREAGIILLGLGTMLWMAFFALKSVSSMANVEPGDLINELLKQLFKVFVALAVLYAGLGVIVDLVINPILGAGADYGLGLVTAAGNEVIKEAYTVIEDKKSDPMYTYAGSRVLSQEVVNKFLELNMAIDKMVSVNMVTGNALMCHSWNAGAWIDQTLLFIEIKVPNLWLLFCGVIIWTLGFMMSVAVSYYLLDVSFKIGLGIMILPITIALWPFSMTSDRLTKALSMIFSAAATFAFLAIIASMSMILIQEAMSRGGGDITDLIAEGKTKEISERFDIGGRYFIIILFGLIYGFLLIGKASKDYGSKFFADEVTGGASPMHHMATQGTMGAVKGAAGAGKLGHDIAKKQVGRKISAGYEKGYGKLKQGIKSGYNKMRGK